MSKNDLNISKNDLKGKKPKKALKCKIKFSFSDSYANETHLWPGEHRLKSSKKKMQNASTFEPFNIQLPSSS